MRLLPQMNAMLDFISTGSVEPRGTRSERKFQNGLIRSIKKSVKDIKWEDVRLTFLYCKMVRYTQINLVNTTVK